MPENDTSYIEEEKKKKNCRVNHQRFNSLCYGKTESGRYCMTPVKTTGDYCNTHGGPRHNASKCDHPGCPEQEPMSIEERRKKISIYKLNLLGILNLCMKRKIFGTHIIVGSKFVPI